MTRSRARWTAIATLAAAAVPGAATAQIRATPPRTFDTPQRSITIAVSSDLLYDTNVARGSDTVAALRGLVKEDLRASPRLAFDLSVPHGPAAATLRGSIGHDSYRRNARLNRERIDIAGTATVPLAFCVVAPEAGYVRGQADLLDLAIDPAAPVRSAVNVQTIRRAAASVHCGPDIGIRPGAFFDRARTTNSAPLRRAQDVTVTGYGSDISYVHPHVGVLTLFVRGRDFRYDGRRDIGLPGADRLRVTDGGLRVDRRLSARLQVQGGVSYAHAAVAGGGANGPALDGLNWRLDATLRIGERLLAGVNSERAIAASPGFFADYVRTSSYGASLAYALSPLAQVSALVSRRDRAFRVDADRPALSITADRIEDATLRLDYLRQPYRLRLDATYRRRDADLDLYDYKGALVMLSASYLFKR